MRIKFYTQYGALNSRPVFDALRLGFVRAGHQVVDSHEDISVIWSVLWQGRMKENQRVYESCLRDNRSVMIVEVGNLKRNITWRLSFDNINRNGIFGNTENLDDRRPYDLGVRLKPEKTSRRDTILIACQHQKSLQWKGLPSTDTWLKDMVQKIRRYSDRKIIIRPHPRHPVISNIPGAVIEKPIKISDSYDEFNIDYNHHCVINHNSGPAVQAAIEGVPVICDQSSLAYPVSDVLENIEKIALKDRDKWFLELCHTEWTLEEIAAGTPIKRLIK